MAVLPECLSNFNRNPFSDLIGDRVAPAGTWPATIIDIRDEYGVRRPEYDNPQVIEIVDLATFLFGFRDQAGQKQLIATKPMRISGSEKANLMIFLTAVLGATPQFGWNYCELKGRQCLVTVIHEVRRNGPGVFAIVKTACPLPLGFVFPNPAALPQPQAACAQPAPPPPVYQQPLQAQQAAAPQPAQQAVQQPAAYSAPADEPLPF